MISIDRITRIIAQSREELRSEFGMRNHLTHDYFGVDLDIVWQTIQDDLRSLETAIKAILNEPS
jgi:uncharacterized protein with HEPN domain